MAITIDEKRLSERQNKYIRKLLFPINSKIAVDRKLQTGSMIIYAKDSSVANHIDLFKTYNENVKANYFEIWKQSNKEQWALQKLYFRIEKKEGFNSYSEILNFHIDLDNIENTYKKYPHIHIKHPKIECISNAHIPLNLNDLSEISNSIDKFNDNVSKILVAINKEFISEFKF